jgi:probable HAF family extracellular repeat protein
MGVAASVACAPQSDSPTAVSKNNIEALAASAQYEAIDIGDLGDGTAEPTAISNNGDIVGTSGSSPFFFTDGTMRALSGWGEPQTFTNGGRIAGVQQEHHTVVVWDSPDTDPRLLDTGSPGRPFTHVIGMNDQGDVLANVDNDVTAGRALLFHDGVPQDLGGFEAPRPVAARSTYATAWNARGQIVGASRADVVVPQIDLFHPFIWENGVMRDLGSLGAFQCGEPPRDCVIGEAVDINARGTVVGRVNGRAFVWENGEMRDLGVYPGKFTRAVAINDRGQILAVGNNAYFVWDHGDIQVIDAPNGMFASTLGQHGEVVGQISTSDGVHAFVWENGQLTDLGPGRALAINQRGEIIGTNGNRAIVWRKAANSTTP